MALKTVSRMCFYSVLVRDVVHGGRSFIFASEEREKTHIEREPVPRQTNSGSSARKNYGSVPKLYQEQPYFDIEAINDLANHLTNFTTGHHQYSTRNISLI